MKHRNLQVWAALVWIPLAGLSNAQQNAPDAEKTTDDLISIAFPNMPIPLILNEYEELTGKRIVRDNAVLGGSLSIETTRKLTRTEAAQFIEKSFLLNGFAFIPAGDDTLKIIAFSGGKNPGSEGVPVITRAEDLPKDGESVVTFILPVENVNPEDAVRTLSTIFPNHSYGKFTPLPEASSIALTENTAVIRKVLEVVQKIDLPPSQIDSKTITLERADAGEVAEALIEILELDSKDDQPTDTLQAARRSKNPQSAAVGQPGMNALATTNGANAVRSFKPQVKAIPRANRLLIVARPVDMAYIESLVAHFDEPLEEKKFVKHKLNYLSVSTFLPIVKDSLLRGLKGDEVQQVQISGGQIGTQNTLSGGGFQSGSSGIGSGTQSGLGGGFGSSGSSGSSIGRGSSGFGSTGGGSANNQDIGPQSIVIDKTLLVADNVHNTLMVSGPSEHQKIISDLLEELDQRPRQIRISAIIAQLTLGDDFEFGMDLVRTLEAVGPEGRKYNGAGLFKSRTGLTQRIQDINTLDVVENFLPAAQGFTFYGQINPYLNAFISSLESTNRFKVLSRPSIYTLNNRRASIFSGQRVAVPRSTSRVLDPNQNTTNQVVTSNIEFEEVLLRIEVLPLINAEDNITLQINQVNDNIIGTQILGGDEVPTIGTQALETTVIVENGGTVLLGGLISDEETKTESGLPLFVNVPLLGKVFGSTKKGTNRQELLIFIQPEIIDNEVDLTKADMKIGQRSEVAESIEEFNPPVAEAVPVAEAEVKKGFFKRMFGKKK